MPSDQDGRSERLRAAAAALDEAVGDPVALVELDPVALQAVLAAATRVLAARHEVGAEVPAFDADAPVAMPSPTDVVVTVSSMLEAASIELIELGLWQTWGNTVGTRGEPDG